MNTRNGEHTIGSDIGRAISDKGFLFGILGMVLVIAISQMKTIISEARGAHLLSNGYHAQFIMEALSSDWVTLAIPILCALPFTTAFVDDIKSGFIKQYLHRTDTASYIKGKLIACGLSGGLTLFAGIMLAYVIAALVFTPMEFALGEGETVQPYLAQALRTLRRVNWSRKKVLFL